VTCSSLDARTGRLAPGHGYGQLVSTKAPSPPVTLRRPTAEEYAVWLARSVESFAKSIETARGLSPAEAVVQSTEEYGRLLPDGLDTENHLVWMAVADARPVGSLWVCTKPPRGGSTPFIFNIMVDEDQRGRGYGRSIMLAAEQECRARGFTRLELNVFGDNRTAVNLYDSLGYQVITQQMGKDL